MERTGLDAIFRINHHLSGSIDVSPLLHFSHSLAHQGQSFTEITDLLVLWFYDQLSACIAKSPQVCSRFFISCKAVTQRARSLVCAIDNFQIREYGFACRIDISVLVSVCRHNSHSTHEIGDLSYSIQLLDNLPVHVIDTCFLRLRVECYHTPVLE